MIRKAEFTSVWDDGKTKVTTSCEVDLKTREIVAIEKKEADVKNLDYQYITIDGKAYPAINLNDTDDFGLCWKSRTVFMLRTIIILMFQTAQQKHFL